MKAGKGDAIRSWNAFIDWASLPLHAGEWAEGRVEPRCMFVFVLLGWTLSDSVCQGVVKDCCESFVKTSICERVGLPFSQRHLLGWSLLLPRIVCLSFYFSPSLSLSLSLSFSSPTESSQRFTEGKER